MSATTTGRINILVGGNAEQFYKTIGGVERRLNTLDKNMKSIASGLAVFAGAFTAIGGSLFAMSVSVGNFADQLLDLEAQTGVSTDTLQEWRQVAIEAGVATDTMADSVMKLQERMARGEEGGKEITDAFRQLSISVKDAEGNLRNSGDIFEELITKLSGVYDISERNRLGVKALGGAWNQLAPIVALGADGIENAKNKAQELGLVIGKDSLIAANNFRISIDTLKSSIEGVKNEIGISFLPIATTLVSFFSERLMPLIRDAIGRFNGLNGATKENFSRFVILGAALSAIVLAISAVVAAFSFVITTLGTTGFLFLAISALVVSFISNLEMLKAEFNYGVSKAVIDFNILLNETKLAFIEAKIAMSKFLRLDTTELDKSADSTRKYIDGLNQGLKELNADNNARIVADYQKRLGKVTAIAAKEAESAKVAEVKSIQEQAEKDEKARKERFAAWELASAKLQRENLIKEIDLRYESPEINVDLKLNEDSLDSILASFEEKPLIVPVDIEVKAPELDETERAIVASANNMAEAFNVAKESLENFNVGIANLMHQALAGTIADSFESMGEVIGNWEDGVTSWGDVANAAWDSILGSIGGFLSQLGDYLIVYGLAGEAYATLTKKLLNPLTAAGSGLLLVGAGIALKLAGGLVKGHLQGRKDDRVAAQNRANGGDVNMGAAYVVGERGRELFVPTTQGTIIANNKMKEFSGSGSMNGEVSFRIRRDELVGILKQDERFKSRF
jgi:hypothetical protein